MPRTFKLLETLGRGAFSSVHLAEVQGDAGFVQRLAVKWLHAQFDENPDLTGRLRDEARLLALLEHDNIVRVHGLTKIGGRLAILMEPVQGADLSKTEGDPMPVRAAIEAVEAVASALMAAWETVPPGQSGPLRVVHRDIKPSNVMVTPRGSVKVMDFGVARASFEAREASTRSQTYGTARYMAPERWLTGAAEAASDIFSLGVTLVELITGEPVERPRLAREAYEEDLERLLGKLSPWQGIRELVQGMCAHDPGDRPSAQDVVDVCRRLAGELEGPGLREWAEGWVPGRIETIPEISEVVREDASIGLTETFPPLVPEDTSVRKRGQGAVAWAALLLLGFSVVVWFMLPDAPVAEPPPVTLPVRVAPVELEPEVVTAEPEPDPEPEAPPEVVAMPVRPRMPPVEEPVPEPAATVTAPVTFILDPPDLEVSTSSGAIRNRAAVELPLGVHQLTITTASRAWRCTVVVDDSLSTWRVSDGRQDCVQVK